MLCILIRVCNFQNYFRALHEVKEDVIGCLFKMLIADVNKKKTKKQKWNSI